MIIPESVWPPDCNAEITFLAGDWSNPMISPISSSLDLISTRASNWSSPIYTDSSANAPFNKGLSDFFLNSLINFAGTWILVWELERFLIGAFLKVQISFSLVCFYFFVDLSDESSSSFSSSSLIMLSSYAWGKRDHAV